LSVGLKGNLAVKFKTPQMADDWSREEVEAAVSDYVDMLDMELRGQPFNKAEHNRNLQKLLNNRPRGSIERKHQNISAILIELGYPYVDGYKPLGNYQRLLRNIVEERLNGTTSLDQAAAMAVEQTAEDPPRISDLLSILVAPPKREEDKPRLYDTSRPKPLLRRKNYLEAEARNRSLGRAGEELILRFERERLWRAGEKKLADRIEHVSKTKSDSLGYDIQSFEIDGRQRLIEVKTTRFGALTPFFASRNEVTVSDDRQAEYQLYRLFKFSQQPRLFVLTGSLHQTCSLEPIQFSAIPN
jgi:hypothetical protein